MKFGAGSPGTTFPAALRRCADMGDAWHPLALGLDNVEKGYATLREMAARLGRRNAPGLALRNPLDLTGRPKGPAGQPFRAPRTEWPTT